MKKLSSLLVKATGLASISLLTGCLVICGDNFVDFGETCDDGNFNNGDGCSSQCQIESAGDVQFSYVVLINDGFGGIIASPDCGIVASAFFAVGDDFDGSGTLDDNEIFEFATVDCNQSDANGDGILDDTEFGLFFATNFTADFYDLFAVEFQDFNGTPIPWQPFDDNNNSTRLSFGGGFPLSANVVNVIPFLGDGAQLNGELQAFFGF